MNTDKTIVKFNPTESKTATASWAQVKYWSNAAANGVALSTAAMVMAGFNLLELRKKMAASGKRTDLLPATSPHDVARLEGAGWQDNVKKFTGVSDETARRWMNTAEAVKAKWKRNPPQERLRELMRMPVSDWTGTDTELVFKSLAKCIDGETMIGFMRELGIAKLKTGNPDAEGDGRRKLSTSEEQQKQLELALEDSHHAGTWTMKSLKTIVLVAQTNELEIDAQLSIHEFAVKALHKLKSTPAAKRDAAWLKEYMAMIEKEAPLKA